MSTESAVEPSPHAAITLPGTALPVVEAVTVREAAASTPEATADDGLRAGDVSFARHFARLFATEPEFVGEPIEGTIAVARYVHNGIASLVTLGLERVPLPDDARIELLCEVVEDQASAAEVAVRIAAQRVLGLLGDPAGPMEPGDVWINSVPFLADTRIQGLVAVDAQWSGRDQTVYDEQGRAVGWINEIVMLTTTEAKRLALDGVVPLLEAASSNPTVRFDVLRDDMVEAPAPLPDRPCAITRAAVEHGVRWLQCDADGRYLAIHLGESPEYLADPANFESAPLSHVVAGVPDLRGFAMRAEPGEYAMLDGETWTFGELRDAP